MDTKNRNRYLPFVMLSVPLLFFAYQFILRLWPGLMMQQIMQQYAIDASSFGMLAAFYYYGYAVMQIPTAILLDRYGARFVVCALAIICGVGTLAFTYTNNFHLALLCRFLIGAGSAVGFLGTSKIISQWFPEQQYARMVGLSFTFGLLGAIYGGKPVSLMINNYGWQQVALVLGILSIVIGVVSSIVLRAPQSQEVAPNTMQGFKQVLSSSNIWILALANLLMVGSLEGFADVWGVQYLMTAYDISRADSAGLISLIFFGMLLGGPLLAKLSKKNGYYSVIVVCGFGLAVCLTLLLSLPQYNKLLISGVFFLVGIMCCYQVIVFSLGSSLVTKQNLGFTVALLNCINMLGGSFFHTSIGLIMDAHWGGALSNDGLRIYELITFKYGIAFVPLCALIGAIMVGVLWFKNTIRYKARVAVTG